MRQRGVTQVVSTLDVSAASNEEVYYGEKVVIGCFVEAAPTIAACEVYIRAVIKEYSNAV